MEKDVQGSGSTQPIWRRARQTQAGTPDTPPANNLSRLATNLDKYFDALSVAATTEKGVLEELG